ncbi:RagB/SusD family nutrient uptake outer membrane protein [Carboxylicivirga sediminis]|uniref:RagB/SusD family nutrient uptake outer membrane protein n=1 Tax=Carboxylicivirga sediminis TaxID=2006564 RepID=A0A941IYY6_9BACT|nr:RagB/SusD family nutrient uptake outer membrane protein [Carboxylicivirga sediminis]MBR8536984.1 RagB/SusD family nutrient uptake outer membrane protein [Carboxylicivirga sediminis]
MNFKTYIIGGLIVLSAWSCDDFLELKPLSEETTATAYTKLSQIEAALTGAYESFQSDAYVWNNVQFQDVRSDNHYAGGDNPSFYEIDYLDISATNDKVNQSWGNIYNAILKANIVLERVDDVTDPLLTEKRKKEIIGEALFLRAYHYYNLVNLYGGVPLILEATKSTDAGSVNIPRSSAEEVFAQIILDLDEASKILPDNYGNNAAVNKARATAGAAWALMAKAYAQKPSPEYNKVLECIDEVEKSAANYKLIDYTHLFDGAHYNNDESILEVQWIAGSDGNWGPQLLLPPSISGDSWRKFVTPSKDLVEAFDAEGDEIRKNATILFENVAWIDEYYGIDEPSDGNAMPNSVAFGYKWKHADGWSSGNRQYLLRYGDIVLLKAEALNETNELALAVAEVNRIRNRVSLDDLTDEQKSSKEVMRQTILNERRLELAQEAQRWDDLVRYGVVVETMNNLVEIDLRNAQAIDYNMTSDKTLLPIPQQELDRNPNLTPNPSN